MMKLDTARQLFQAKAVRNPEIVPHALKAGRWLIQFEANKSVWQHVTLESRRGAVREFASLEAAGKMVQEIGFKSALVRWE